MKTSDLSDMITDEYTEVLIRLIYRKGNRVVDRQTSAYYKLTSFSLFTPQFVLHLILDAWTMIYIR